MRDIDVHRMKQNRRYISMNLQEQEHEKKGTEDLPVKCGLIGTEVKGIKAEIAGQRAVKMGGRGATRLPQRTSCSVHSDGTARLQCLI